MAPHEGLGAPRLHAGEGFYPYPFLRLSGMRVSVDKSLNASKTSASQGEQSRVRLAVKDKRESRRAQSRRDQGEARLVESAKRGDKRAVGELYQRHVDMIYRYTYARVKNVAVAEDLTAQVFLKALEGLENYEYTGAPFRAWLYRIAHARTVDYWRRQQRRQEVLLPDSLPAPLPSPEEIVAARVEWRGAVELISRLTDDQRDVIILRFIEAMSLAEVAEVMDKTVGAVKALQHRALASMARLKRRQANGLRDKDG